jgi:hypothetical protein
MSTPKKRNWIPIVLFGIILATSLYFNWRLSTGKKALSVELGEQITELESTIVDTVSFKQQKIDALKESIKDSSSSKNKIIEKYNDFVERASLFNPFDLMSLSTSVDDEMEYLWYLRRDCIEGGAPISLMGRGCTSPAYDGIIIEGKAGYGYNSIIVDKIADAMIDPTNASLISKLYNKNRDMILGFLKKDQGAQDYLWKTVRFYLVGEQSAQVDSFFTGLRKEYPNKGPLGIANKEDLQKRAKSEFGWSKKEFYSNYSNWWWAKRRHADGSAQTIVNIIYNLWNKKAPKIS